MITSMRVLQASLERFVGVPFGDVVDELGVQGIERPAASRKALAGDVAEAMFGLAKNSVPAPDLEHLGLEAKSVPIGRDGRPQENTKVAALNLATVLEQRDFATSHVYAKVRAILFMPVQKNDKDKPREWYLRPPFVWLPSTEDLTVLRNDYMNYIDHIASKRFESLRLGSGVYLGVNTSGAASRGMPSADKPYAWWLKTSLTRRILDANLRAF